MSGRDNPAMTSEFGWLRVARPVGHIGREDPSMIPLKLIQIGKSLGVVLNNEALVELGAKRATPPT